METSPVRAFPRGHREALVYARRETRVYAGREIPKSPAVGASLDPGVHTKWQYDWLGPYPMAL